MYKVISHAMMGPSRPEVVRGDAVGGGPRGRGGMAWGVGGRRFGFGLGTAGWASDLGSHHTQALARTIVEELLPSVYAIRDPKRRC